MQSLEIFSQSIYSDMENEKYSNYPLSISAILGLIEANDIAIPEIQRPFVWRRTQVRHLIDSL